MNSTRRSFLSALAALPLLGCSATFYPAKHERPECWEGARGALFYVEISERSGELQQCDGARWITLIKTPR
jgi:hypothetical protein